ncbi:glycosyltransferase [Campylobacter lari]|uniref:glycosyltransferase family 2 protein n=1 Tax=Campylobacter sp. CNRCH_2014_2452 TaxID=2911603 RepID=UPI00126B568A|nr:glycosyltransferase family 2 protein [Campylobacter sp. CNRCH_2014_2452]EAJ6153364.1 glycosyltransferase [Campylobacter lari]EAK0817866.1 glycosyltransferase [Campylobacter lari]EAK5578608.1 glycosyltransferase [Campylobacter lari]EAK9890887.1 glycosyltransferase [Campylobacter lari]EGK8026212.1 glycosyltransferase [Campylobacter lari]
MNNPLISIIIPIYNVAPYLKECLDSVVNQSYKHLDIVLVDDGSDDESLDIALEYLNKDERIFLISKENGGLSSARNMGLEFIKGTKLRSFFEDDKEQDIISFTSTHTFDKNTKIISKEAIKSNFIQIQKRYIKTNIENINDLLVQELPNSIIHFLDSDDYFLNDCIELCVKEMIEKDLDICAHGFEEYHEKNSCFLKKPPTDLMQKSKKIFFNTGIELLQENNFFQFYFAWQGTFKAKILNQYNLRFTHGIYHEDHDFGTILFCLAKKVFYINTTLMIYRIRKGSITNIQNTLIPQKLPKYLEPLKEHFNDYKELRKYFKLFCFIKIAEQIQNFNNKSKTNSFFLEKTSKEYMYNYLKESKQKDPLNIRDILQNKLKYFYLYNFLFKIRFYLRHPRKIFQDRT